MSTQNSIVKELETAVARTHQVGNQGKVLDIIQYPDPRLREVSTPVLQDILDPTLQAFLQDMVTTMNHWRALGLAAVQVGVLSRILVVRDNDGSPVVAINPVIVDSDGEVLLNEGCLSFPGLFLNVRRPADVTVQYFDAGGVRRTSMADKMLGRSLLHEMGHLDGELFIDLVPKILRSQVLKKYEVQLGKLETLQKKVATLKANVGKSKYVKKTKAERQKEKKKRAAGKKR